MAWSDIANVLETLAPTVASALGTPLLGGAVAALETAFGLTPKPSDSLNDRQEALAAAIQGATPEQLAAVRKADQDYAARMAEAGFADKEAIAKLQVQEETLYVDDTADARKVNAQSDKVFNLGIVVLITFAAVMGASLYGAYCLLIGTIPVKDVAMVGMVSGFVGTIIGYVSANAQQVVSFFFGSSKGSEANAAAMAGAFTSTFGGGAPGGKAGTGSNSTAS
jgi:hypothetical protein